MNQIYYRPTPFQIIFDVYLNSWKPDTLETQKSFIFEKKASNLN